MKTHRPWQPRMRSGSLFNPFVPTTEAPFENDHFAIEEEEGQEQEQNAAPEAAAAPDQDSEGKK